MKRFPFFILAIFKRTTNEICEIEFWKISQADIHKKPNIFVFRVNRINNQMQ